MEQVKTLMAELGPLIGEAIAIALLTAITLIIRSAATWLKDWIALQRIHLAAQTGIDAAIVANPEVTAQMAASEAVDHILYSVPDSVRRLNVRGERLATIAQSKLLNRTA